MRNQVLYIAAGCLSVLISCTPPLSVPPPRFQPDPPFTLKPMSPDGSQIDLAPPPSPSQLEPDPPTATGGYPAAQRTENPDQVLSPYGPFNVIDVTGFKSGQLARDPSNQKIFRVP